MKVISTQYGANPYFQGKLTITNSRKGRVRVFETPPDLDTYLENVFDKCFMDNSCHGWVFSEDIEPYEEVLKHKLGMNLPMRTASMERPIEAYERGKYYILNIPGVYKIKHELYNNHVYRTEYGDYYTKEV